MIKVRKLLNWGISYFGSGSYNTEEFNEFFNLFKRSFNKELKKIGAYGVVYSKGHFYLSGFFTVNEQAYYFSLSDVRGNNDIHPKLLVRTAKHYKDYTGGSNMWVNINSGMYRDLAIKCGLNLSELNVEKKETRKEYIENMVNEFMFNFSNSKICAKRIPSMSKANSIAWKLADKFNLPSQSITITKCGKTIVRSKMENDVFKFKYEASNKEMFVELI